MIFTRKNLINIVILSFLINTCNVFCMNNLKSCIKSCTINVEELRKAINSEERNIIHLKEKELFQCRSTCTRCIKALLCRDKQAVRFNKKKFDESMNKIKENLDKFDYVNIRIKDRIICVDRKNIDTLKEEIFIMLETQTKTLGDLKGISRLSVGCILLFLIIACSSIVTLLASKLVPSPLVISLGIIGFFIVFVLVQTNIRFCFQEATPFGLKKLRGLFFSCAEFKSVKDMWVETKKYIESEFEKLDNKEYLTETDTSDIQILIEDTTSDSD